MTTNQLSGFGQLSGVGEKIAIIVVDYIKGFTNETCPLGSNLDQEVEATRDLLQHARENEIPIIFTTVVYEPHFKDGAYFVQKVPALKCLTADSEWVEVDPRLDHQKDSEPLVIKKFASSFFGTSLSSILAYEKVDTTMIVGCTTSGCVRATVVDALQYGYRVIVPKECVGDRSQKAHQANLFDIQTKYGDVISVEEAKELLELN